MLISTDYRKEMERLNEGRIFGSAGNTFAPLINEIIQKAGITHLLDYGCGKMLLRNEIKNPPPDFKYQAYDPGVPRLASPPSPAELVVCLDVLEHVEPDCIEDVLDHLEELTEVILFASVCTGPAVKKLSDGRNAHLIQQPLEWWLPKIMDRFDLQTVQMHRPNQFFVIANRQGLEIDADDTETEAGHSIQVP